MVINKTGLITESDKLTENIAVYTEDIENFEDRKETDITLKTDIESSNETISNNTEDVTVNIANDNENSYELCQKETAETNCLALTVRKDYNISIVKNTILTTFRFSWKIAFSTLVLNVLKLFL